MGACNGLVAAGHLVRAIEDRGRVAGGAPKEPHKLQCLVHVREGALDPGQVRALAPVKNHSGPATTPPPALGLSLVLGDAGRLLGLVRLEGVRVRVRPHKARLILSLVLCGRGG